MQPVNPILLAAAIMNNGKGHEVSLTVFLGMFGSFALLAGVVYALKRFGVDNFFTYFGLPAGLAGCSLLFFIFLCNLIVFLAKRLFAK